MFLKRNAAIIFIALACFGCGLISAAAANQADSPGQAESLGQIEALSTEGPLTEADIKAYLALYPQLVAAAANDDQKAFDQEAEKIYLANGLTPTRAVYVLTKVNLTQAILSGGLPIEQIPKEYQFMVPSANEKALVMNHSAEIMSTMALAAKGGKQ